MDRQKSFDDGWKMTELHTPNWRNFISLKGETSLSKVETEKTSNGRSQPAVEVVVSSTHPPPPKKRKVRTDEEIAQRKAKKLKSKGKEDQEWKRLTDDHARQQNTTEDSVPEPSAATPPAQESLGPKSVEKTSLSAKAKQITKMRQTEKILIKEGRQIHVSQQAENDKKRAEIDDYLKAYREHMQSGTPWKFKKQYQNWIVKHVRDGWKDDELWLLYLKSVKGKARERIIEETKRFMGIADETLKGGETSEHELVWCEKIVKALEE
jgi:WKF domain